MKSALFVPSVENRLLMATGTLGVTDFPTVRKTCSKCCCTLLTLISLTMRVCGRRLFPPETCSACNRPIMGPFMKVHFLFNSVLHGLSSRCQPLRVTGYGKVVAPWPFCMCWVRGIIDARLLWVTWKALLPPVPAKDEGVQKQELKGAVSSRQRLAAAVPFRGSIKFGHLI